MTASGSAAASRRHIPPSVESAADPGAVHTYPIAGKHIEQRTGGGARILATGARAARRGVPFPQSLLLGGQIFLLALSAPAFAATTIRPDSWAPKRLQRWIDRARTTTATETLLVTTEGCPPEPSRSCTHPEHEQIWLRPTAAYENPGYHLRERRRASFFHELGHRFDYRVLTDAIRQRFSARFTEGRPWNDDDPWKPAPAEVFAQAWAWCALGFTASRDPWGYGYGWWPSRSEHREACRIASAA